MAVEFYDVKTKQKVSIQEDKVTKTKFVSESGRTTYGLRGTTADGRKVTKFVAKDMWEKMHVPEEKTPKKEAAPKKEAPKKK